MQDLRRRYGGVTALDGLTLTLAPGELVALLGRAGAGPAKGRARRPGRDSFTAVQAGARGGHRTCKLDGSRVLLGGNCVTVMEGSFLL